MYIYICMCKTKSLCCRAEMNTTLQVNYTWIKTILKLQETALTLNYTKRDGSELTPSSPSFESCRFLPFPFPSCASSSLSSLPAEFWGRLPSYKDSQVPCHCAQQRGHPGELTRCKSPAMWLMPFFFFFLIPQWRPRKLTLFQMGL